MQQWHTFVLNNYSGGMVDVRIVASKTKVSLTKGQSIPWLELMAALLLSRLVGSAVSAKG